MTSIATAAPVAAAPARQPVHQAPTPLDITPLAVRIGARIDNLELSGELAPATVAAIRAALLKHKVIFFPRQTQLSARSHEAFAKLLGTLQAHPARPALEGTEVTLTLDGRLVRSNTWHTDLTFLNAFPSISVLRGEVIPPLGGDTLWANTASAYEHLPEPLQRLADSLWATHCNVFDNSALLPDDSAAALAYQAELARRKVIETDHPLVHVHPETGERALLLGHFIKRIIGLSSVDTGHLLALFNHHVTAPENVVRWRWQTGDIAIWDNRATQHRAIDDYGTQERIVRRVTLAGTPTRSIDGRGSVTRSTA
ncbi:MAG: TauD/TfdA dioxygenase family protein [Janthinobacterium lividum]